MSKDPNLPLEDEDDIPIWIDNDDEDTEDEWLDEDDDFELYKV